VTESVVLPPEHSRVCVMTASQRTIERQGARAESSDRAGEADYLEWSEQIRKIAEPADPLQSETVKGWLRSALRAPK
jgi:hypothetical protein